MDGGNENQNGPRLQDILDQLLHRVNALESQVEAVAHQNALFSEANRVLRSENDQLRLENDRLKSENARLGRMADNLQEALGLARMRTMARLPVSAPSIGRGSAQNPSPQTPGIESRSVGGNRIRQTPSTARYGYSIAFGTTVRRNILSGQGAGKVSKFNVKK